MKALVITSSMGRARRRCCAELSRLREPGLWQQKYVDFSLANDGIRRVTDVAGEILQRAGWGGPFGRGDGQLGLRSRLVTAPGC